MSYKLPQLSLEPSAIIVLVPIFNVSFFLFCELVCGLISLIFFPSSTRARPSLPLLSLFIACDPKLFSCKGPSSLVFNLRGLLSLSTEDCLPGSSYRILVVLEVETLAVGSKMIPFWNPPRRFSTSNDSNEH